MNQPREVMYDLAASYHMIYAPFAVKKATRTHNTIATRPLTKGARSLNPYFKAVFPYSCLYLFALLLLKAR